MGQIIPPWLALLHIFNHIAGRLPERPGNLRGRLTFGECYINIK